jgi:hypothetical protein
MPLMPPRRLRAADGTAEQSASGPFSVAATQQHLRAGRLRSDSLGWCEGMDGWLPLEQAPQLVASLGLKVHPVPTRLSDKSRPHCTHAHRVVTA